MNSLFGYKINNNLSSGTKPYARNSTDIELKVMTKFNTTNFSDNKKITAKTSIYMSKVNEKDKKYSFYNELTTTYNEVRNNFQP